MATLDGTVVDIRCPNQPTVTCVSGAFTLYGNPETVILQLQSADGELEASATFHPIYGQPHHDAACQTTCLVAHETVTLE